MPHRAELLGHLLPIDLVRVKILEFVEAQHEVAVRSAEVQGRAHAEQHLVDSVPIDQIGSQAVRRWLPAIAAAAKIAEHKDADRSVGARLNRQRAGLGVHVDSHGST
jgi:hypothetical protein